jgi:hypothetical protein
MKSPVFALFGRCSGAVRRCSGAVRTISFSMLKWSKAKARGTILAAEGPQMTTEKSSCKADDCAKEISEYTVCIHGFTVREKCLHGLRL